MKTFAKYLLFEIPQWFLLAVILWILAETADIPVWAVQGVFVIWVLKDIALFPRVRNAYENNAKTGTEELIGVKATTQDRLDPEGFVRIQGVLWKARAEPANQPINRDTIVTVCAAHGLTLIVQADDQKGTQNISFKA
jgi:membrane-bound ClpP family serine protease